MFEPLSTLFKSDNNKKEDWQESELKYFVQNFLREKLKTDQLYCHKVSKGTATIRVVSPTFQQEVVLLEHDLKQMLLAEADYELKKVIVGS